MITLQRFKSNQGLSYVKQGEGPAIVLIHGVGLCADAWLHQIEILAQKNTVYAIDMPGHGESDLLDQQADLNHYVDHIADWIESDIKRKVIVMGHSMGAMISIQIAIHYPHLCHGAVALNLVYQRSNDAKIAVQKRAQTMLNNPELDRVSAPILRWFGDAPEGYEKEMSELCATWLNNAPAQGYAKAYDIFSRNDGPKTKDLTLLELPVLYITGDSDHNSSPVMSHKLAEITPNGVAHIIKNSGHMVQLTHPDDINSLLLQFVEQCEVNKSGNI